MNILKIKTVSAALLLSLIAVGASAQPQQRKAPRYGEEISAEKKAEAATDKLDQVLELTDAQEAKILAINLKYAKVREGNRPERPAKADGKKPARPSREEMKAKAEAAASQKKAHATEIMQVLNDEQKVEYAQFMAKAKDQKRPMRKGKKGNKGKRPTQGCKRSGTCNKSCPNA